MKPQDLDILRKAHGKYRQVKVSRSVEDSTLYGFVVGLSDSLLALYGFNDFHPDGCCLVRLSDITHVVSGDQERALDRVLAAEGLLDSVGIASMPPLGTMEVALRHLAERGTHVILELEEADAHNDDEMYLSYGEMIESLESMLDDLRTSEAAGKSYEAWLAEDDEEAEGEDDPFAEDCFLIGRLVRVEDGDVLIHHFDANGVWDAEPTAAKVSNVTCVQLETPYLATWLRHVGPCPEVPGDA